MIFAVQNTKNPSTPWKMTARIGFPSQTTNGIHEVFVPNGFEKVFCFQTADQLGNVNLLCGLVAGSGAL